MRVGFLAPAGFTFGNIHSGVVALARLSVAAAARAGCEPVLLSPWEHISEQRLDAVHAFSMSSSFDGPRDTTDVPWILTPVHDSLKQPAVYRSAIAVGRLPRLSTEAGTKAALLRRFDHVIAMSNDERERLVNHFRIDRSRISVVHCPAPDVVPMPADQVEGALRQLGVDAEDFALAVCDYGARRKNAVRLVKAALATDTHLILAGNASASRDLGSIRRLAGRAATVTLLGPVSAHHKTALMQAAGIYCQPSLQEGAGLAAMEAARLDCRVVASDVGGVRDHLGPEAVWVDPTSVRSIAGGLVTARRQCSGSVRAYVEAHRSFEVFAAELANVYRQVATR